MKSVLKYIYSPLIITSACIVWFTNFGWAGMSDANYNTLLNSSLAYSDRVTTVAGGYTSPNRGAPDGTQFEVQINGGTAYT